MPNSDLERVIATTNAARSAVTDLRMTLAALRVLDLLRKANFNPDQPRVPAGDPDGGQWMLVGQDGGGDYAVDLRQEELRGGHTIRKHIGKSDRELLERVRRGRFSVLFLTFVQERAGSFPSLEAGNDFVNRTIERNKPVVDLVASGRRGREFIKARFGYPTGKEAIQSRDLRLRPYMRVT